MSDDSHFLAVETGGTKILARLVQGETLVAEKRWPTTTPDAAEAALLQFAGDAPIAGIGIAAFGPVTIDPHAANYGEVLKTVKPHWTGANLRRTLSARLGAPAAIDTDVNLAAVAEQARGAGRGCASVAYVTVGTGLGAGLARDGKTLSGALHPEVGHVPVLRMPGDLSPSACSFHPSCAEGLAAGPGIHLRMQGRKLEESPEDYAAIADYIGQLFATIVMVWSPYRIVAGGGVLSVPGLREAAANRMHPALGGYGVGDAAQRDDFIVAAELENAGLEGALLLARAVARA